ncbi:hypothetical protein EMPS_03834 [Entomortierella parvispora]|uniref:F-box domain-containing protein n=1 Tax=Entomortierella parvispora TaxID=205924 RepID=A0A9P3LV09_9FUNG|nr:hypothetical protein EMPS_03834 [Entomortierella parvispora]
MTQHALDIPEITELIVAHLTRKHFYVCIQVSRRWHDAFVPFIWNFALLKKLYFSNYPPPEGLQRYAHLIGQLSYRDIPTSEVPRYFQINFPNLDSFHAHYLPWSQWTKDERKYWGEKNPLHGFLERLPPRPLSLTLDSHFDELKDETDGELEHSIWKTIRASCKTIQTDSNMSIGYGPPSGLTQSLRSLTLHRVTFHWREMDACDGIWDVLKGLDRLSIRIWSHSRLKSATPTGKAMTVMTKTGDMATATQTLNDLQHPFEKMAGAKIQHLTIQYCEHGDPTLHSEFELVRQCRDLRSLAWVNPSGDNDRASRATAFTREVQAGRWPYLESLRLSISYLNDRELGEMISSMIRPIRELTIHGSAFHILASEALLKSGKGRHVNSLEVLVIPEAKRVHGGFFQEILCSAPKLVTLHGWKLTDLDIWRNPKPWVCHKLKDFQMSLCFELSEPVAVGTLFSKAKDARQTLHPVASTPPRPLEMVTDEDTTAVFLDRLAKCKELETLLLGQREHLPQTNWRGQRELTRLSYQTLELDHGLDRLKTLRHLQRLDMRLTYMAMTELEAIWMMEQWPSLKELRASQLSPDIDLARMLWSGFRERGIQRGW